LHGIVSPPTANPDLGPSVLRNGVQAVGQLRLTPIPNQSPGF
jgi:hypothetical protein